MNTSSIPRSHRGIGRCVEGGASLQSISISARCSPVTTTRRSSVVVVAAASTTTATNSSFSSRRGTSPSTSRKTSKKPTHSNNVDPYSSLLIDDGGPPRFYSPVPPADVVEARARDASELPLLFFLPGIDGVGLAAARQWPKLAPLFDLRVMAVPSDDRTTLDGLVDAVVSAIENEGRGGKGEGENEGKGGEIEGKNQIPQSRPIYLAGESFGASLALLVAARAPGLVDRLVLVNPATSFSRSAWSSIAPLLARAPGALYGALPLALAPALGNPISIAAGAVTSLPPWNSSSGSSSSPSSAPWNNLLPSFPALLSSNPATAARELAVGASELLPQLRALSGALPAATLEWRLELIKEAEARLLRSEEGGAEKEGNKQSGSTTTTTTTKPLLNGIKQRTLIVAGGRDTLLPSADEAERLEKAMPRAKKVVLPRAGHAMLQEGGVDLGAIAVGRGFYCRERRFSSAGFGEMPRRAAAGAMTGPADPVDLPTPAELDDWSERATSLVRRLTSPVFFSFDGKKKASSSFSSSSKRKKKEKEKEKEKENNRDDDDDDDDDDDSYHSSQTFARGLAGIPSRRESESGDDDVADDDADNNNKKKAKKPTKPILFVGNHQLMALDMGVLVEEVYREKGILMRGLAHPAIFSSSMGGSSEGEGKGEGVKDGENASPSSSSAPLPSLPRLPPLFNNNDSNSNNNNNNNDSKPPRSANRFEAFMTEWGAVPVSGRNFFKLLSAGEAVLLFPGGAREAYKRKGEEYVLFWPRREEFVRMAARFGATIIPFAAVGSEDSITLALDSDELVNLPFGVGDWIAERARRAVPRGARRGVSAAEDVEGLFLTPLALPKGLPERQYFVFREPIELDGEEVRAKLLEGGGRGGGNGGGNGGETGVGGRDEAQKIYERVKREVEEGIAWLRLKREEDEYRFAAARLAYEAAAGTQAPTFDPADDDEEGEEEEEVGGGEE